MRKSEVSSTLTVYHDGQFWVGVVEHVENGMLSVARVVFGAEPSNEEVYTWVLERWSSLRLSAEAEPVGWATCRTAARQPQASCARGGQGDAPARAIDCFATCARPRAGARQG